MLRTDYLFLDVETVPMCNQFSEIGERLQKLFLKKFAKDIESAMSDADASVKAEEIHNKVWQRTAGLHAEFNRIVCISIGMFLPAADGGKRMRFRVKALTDGNEASLMLKFHSVITQSKPTTIIGHNGKGFDFPLLSRKFLMHKLSLPTVFNTIGKKPWEVSHLDTMEMWAFGEWNKRTSLDLLAATFNIPTPKDVMDGSEVRGYFYEKEKGPEDHFSQKGLDQIGVYCNKDVVTCAQVHCALTGEDPFSFDII